MDTKTTLMLGGNAGSRSGETVFEWDPPGTWPAAVRDLAAAYVTYYPDLERGA